MLTIIPLSCSPDATILRPISARTTAAAKASMEEKPSAIRATRRMLRAYLIAAGLCSLRRRKRADMLTERMGYGAAAAQMFNHLWSIAAFGFVAFLLVFVHPASQASRTAAPQAAAGGMIVAASVAAAIVRSRLAASK